MKSTSVDFSPIDNFIFNNFTKKVPNLSSKTKRNIFICNVDHSKKCKFAAHHRSTHELYRLFNHLEINHSSVLFDSLLKFLTKNPNLIEPKSTCRDISNYLEKNIFPKILSDQQKSLDSKNHNSETNETSKCFTDLNEMDFIKLSQIIIEK